MASTDRKVKEKDNLKAARKVKKKLNSAIKLARKGKLPITRKEGEDQFSRIFGKSNPRKRK
jgi:hypothetical protein